jgi:hypothetical protein
VDSYDFSAACGGDLVVAFHGIDLGGPAAALVSAATGRRAIQTPLRVFGREHHEWNTPRGA